MPAPSNEDIDRMLQEDMPSAAPATTASSPQSKQTMPTYGDSNFDTTQYEPGFAGWMHEIRDVTDPTPVLKGGAGVYRDIANLVPGVKGSAPEQWASKWIDSPDRPGEIIGTGMRGLGNLLAFGPAEKAIALGAKGIGNLAARSSLPAITKAQQAARVVPKTVRGAGGRMASNAAARQAATQAVRDAQKTALQRAMAGRKAGLWGGRAGIGALAGAAANPDDKRAGALTGALGGAAVPPALGALIRKGDYIIAGVAGHELARHLGWSWGEGSGVVAYHLLKRGNSPGHRALEVVLNRLGQIVSVTPSGAAGYAAGQFGGPAVSDLLPAGQGQDEAATAQTAPAATPSALPPPAQSRIPKDQSRVQ